MAFSIPVSGKHPDCRPSPLITTMLSMLMLCTGACSQNQRDFGIQLADVSVNASPAGVNIRARHDVKLSQEAREALRNGVPLRVRVDLALQKSGAWSEISRDSISYEIRYLPLSDLYQLSGPAPATPPRTFPRLRHVLAELREIEWQIRNVEAQPGNYEVRIRSRLDRTGMPGPMQLPMLFSSVWNHDSGWISHDFRVRG